MILYLCEHKVLRHQLAIEHIVVLICEIVRHMQTFLAQSYLLFAYLVTLSLLFLNQSLTQSCKKVSLPLFLVNFTVFPAAKIQVSSRLVYFGLSK